MDSAESTPKSTTIEHRIYIMQHLADFLNRRGFSAYRIPSELIPRRVHDFVPYIFTYDEITRILAVVDGFQFNKCSPKRHIVYPLLFRVLCFCGLRISEALNLTVGDVHCDDGFFLLRNTKTSLDRLIPLDDNLRARFMAYSEQMGFLRKDEYFFLHRMVPDTVSQQWTQRLGIFFLGLVFHTAARGKVHGCMT